MFIVTESFSTWDSDAGAIIGVYSTMEDAVRLQRNARESYDARGKKAAERGSTWPVCRFGIHQWTDRADAIAALEEWIVRQKTEPHRLDGTSPSCWCCGVEKGPLVTLRGPKRSVDLCPNCILRNENG